MLHRLWQLKGRVYSTIVRVPPESAPRIAPTPLVFVSANGWDVSSSGGLSFFSSMLAQKGYTCLQIDLPLSTGAITQSEQLMSAFTTSLHKEIRMSTMPFPPIILARSFCCLIAQQYISSHPASGLFLMSPPPSNLSVPKDLLPTTLADFNYEPRFPIAVMSTEPEMVLLRAQNRLVNDPGVDTMSVSDPEGKDALAGIEEWLDLLGV